VVDVHGPAALLDGLVPFRSSSLSRPATRSGADEAGEMFRAGMDLYQAGKFSEAGPGFAKGGPIDPEGAGDTLLSWGSAC